MPEDIVELTWEQLERLFIDYNNKCDDLNNGKEQAFGYATVLGYVVYSQDNFADAYSEESRTYVFNNDNKAFHTWMGGYSIFASSLDMSDRGVRLTDYDWRIERCYMMKNDYDYLQDFMKG